MGYDYPMMLDVSDRLAVIVGGGSVAARKAAGLIDCGAARVRCVSPAFDPGMPAPVERVEARYAPIHLDGAGLVFAATDDPAVNEAVVRDARSRGLLVNRADADEDSPGDFVSPARLAMAAVTVAVSAGSPALAVRIRDGIAQRWDANWSRMADAMRGLRPLVVARKDLPPSQRRHIFRDLATDEAADVLAAGGEAALRAWLVARHPELDHG